MKERTKIIIEVVDSVSVDVGLSGSNTRIRNVAQIILDRLGKNNCLLQNWDDDEGVKPHCPVSGSVCFANVKSGKPCPIISVQKFEE